jgi:protocatechuate 3,4-dioxygenase beta subunit
MKASSMISMSWLSSRCCFLQNVSCVGATLSAAVFASSGRNDGDIFDSLPKSARESARTNGLVMIHRPTPEPLSNCTEIVSENEPGKRLIIRGQIFTPRGITPVPGITVYAYNTDVEGYYGENHREYPPRLFGWMKTNMDGRFVLRTVLPGSYPGMHIPAHEHFTVWGEGYPPQWIEELRFEGDR